MLRRRARPRDAADTVPVTVTVTDDQDDLPVDTERAGALVAAVLVAEGVAGPGEANVLFVGADAMAELNHLHMGKDGPTDVLSFPIDGGDELDDAEERMVGDVVVCPAVAFRNAPGHAGSYADELALLLVHGTLHLLGHDHADDADRRRMWARERELLAAHHGPLQRDPWTD